MGGTSSALRRGGGLRSRRRPRIVSTTERPPVVLAPEYPITRYYVSLQQPPCIIEDSPPVLTVLGAGYDGVSLKCFSDRELHVRPGNVDAAALSGTAHCNDYTGTCCDRCNHCGGGRRMGETARGDSGIAAPRFFACVPAIAARCEHPRNHLRARGGVGGGVLAQHVSVRWGRVIYTNSGTIACCGDS